MIVLRVQYKIDIHLKPFVTLLWSVGILGISTSCVEVSVSRNENIQSEKVEQSRRLSEDATMEILVADEYISWVEHQKNGLRIQKAIGDYQYNVQYKPVEYVLLKEGHQLDKKVLSKQKKELEALEHFTLRLSTVSQKDLLKGNASNYQAYQEILNYYAYEMQKDIHLIDGNDTLACMMYHFERNYGVAPFRNFVLGFERNSRQNKKDKVLVIHNQIANQGIVKIKFHSDKLRQVPKVKL